MDPTKIDAVKLLFDLYPKAPGWWRDALPSHPELCIEIFKCDCMTRRNKLYSFNYTMIRNALEYSDNMLLDVNIDMKRKLPACHARMLYYEIIQNNAKVSVDQRMSRQKYNKKVDGKTFCSDLDEILYKSITKEKPIELYFIGEYFYAKFETENGFEYSKIQIEITK